MSRHRVLLAVDRLDWAFANIARQLVVHLAEEFDFKIMPYRAATSGEYDVVVAFWWASACLLRGNTKSRRLVLCLYDGYSWTSPASRKQLDLAVKRSDILVAGNEQIAVDANLPLPTWVAEDGVDTTRFSPRPLPATVRFGWTGNSGATRATTGGADIKGLSIIREAAALASAALVTHDIAEKPPLLHEAMPSWYAAISAYICASGIEGTPNPVLEAMACGRPVITTRVGLTRRIVAHGVNGLFVDRTAESIAAAMNTIATRSDLEKMGQAARDAAEAHDWRSKIHTWRSCLRAAVRM